MLDYDYFNKYYKIIVIDLNKQQALDGVQNSIHQFNFTANLEREATIAFIIEEAREKVSVFSQGTVKLS